jgi:hypothetical protein
MDDKKLVRSICPGCGTDIDKLLSERGICPVTLVLCMCGKYVVPGEGHYLPMTEVKIPKINKKKQRS